MMDGQEGFEVTDVIDVPDMSEVKEQRTLIPAAKDVRFRIVSGAVMASNDKTIKGLNLRLAIVEGIDVLNKDTGEYEKKFIGREMTTGLMTLVVWADKSVGARPGSDWWKNDQHLVGLKQFCMAMGIPLTGIKINDAFIGELVGKEVIATIVHEEGSVKDENGTKQKTGVFQERLKFFKKAS